MMRRLPLALTVGFGLVGLTPIAALAASASQN